MNRLSNFGASAANSGLNLVLVLLVARIVPMQWFADFTAGMVYGGPFAVLLAFGNDTILARTFATRPGFGRLVASVRIAAFLPVLAVVTFVHSVSAGAGFALVTGAALQQRFFFEARNDQITINFVGIAEKLVSLVGVLYCARPAYAMHLEILLWSIISAKTCAGVLVTLFIIIKDRTEIGRGVLIDGFVLCVGALPFLYGYVATQLPALLLVGNTSSRLVADFGTASQVGAGLVAILTLWQRPAVHRYIRNDVSIRRELVFSVTLAATAALIVYVGVALYGNHFKLLSEWSVVYGFILLALVVAVLHPFEIRGFASGRISGRGLSVSALSVLLVAVPLSNIVGFWAVPLAMIQYQLVIFLYHRLWMTVGDERQSSSMSGDIPRDV